MTAREDFDTAITLLADLLEEKLDGEIDFSEDFEPWTYLRETMPPLADKLQEETAYTSEDANADTIAAVREEIRQEFLRRDPNNASRMRDYFG